MAKRKRAPTGFCRHCGIEFSWRRFYHGKSCGWKKSSYCGVICRAIHRGWATAGTGLGIMSLPC